MSISQVDELLMMTADEIDFSALQEDILIQLALSEEEFIATEALAELQYRQSNSTNEVAKKILMDLERDIYLKAAAFETLFELDTDSSINYMLENVKEFHPYIFSSMIRVVLENRNCLSAKKFDKKRLQVFLERAKKDSEALDKKAILDLETMLSLNLETETGFPAFT